MPADSLLQAAHGRADGKALRGLQHGRFILPPLRQIAAQRGDGVGCRAVRLKIQHIAVRRKDRHGKVYAVGLQLSQHGGNGWRVLHKIAVQHQRYFHFCAVLLQTGGGSQGCVVCALAANDLIMPRGAAMHGNAKGAIAAVQVGLDYGILIGTVHERNAGCHAMMVILNVLGLMRRAQNLIDLRVVDRLMIQGKRDLIVQAGGQRVQPFQAG